MFLAVCWAEKRSEIFNTKSDYYDIKPSNLVCIAEEWRL